MIYDHEFDTSKDWYRLLKLSRGSMTANKSSKHIVVLPYIPDWPKTFEVESQKIKNVLGDNCIAVHHVGSTSFRMC